MSKKLILIFITLSLVFFFIIALNNKSITNPNNNKTSIAVSTAQKGTFSTKFKVLGTIESASVKKIYWNNSITVSKVLVKEGDLVKIEDKLFEFDFSEIDNAISNEQNNNSLLQLQINQSKEELESKINSAEIQLNSDFANLDLARNNLEYDKNQYNIQDQLYSSDAISKSTLDALRKTLHESQVKFDLAQKNYNTSLNSYNSAINNNSNLLLLQEKLKSSNSNISDLQEKKNTLSKLQFADSSGTILNLQVFPCTYQNPLTTMYTINDTNNLVISADLDQKYYDKISLGQKINILSNDSYGNLNIEGTITKISPTFKSNNDSNNLQSVFTVKISVDSNVIKNLDLKIGMSFQCSISFNNASPSILCDFADIMEDEENNYYVFCYDEDSNLIKKCNVQIGSMSDSKVEIIAGVSAGDLIVKKPSSDLKDGDVINNVNIEEGN